jgi:hypothetical protein
MSRGSCIVAYIWLPQVDKEAKADAVGGIGTTLGKAAKVATVSAMHGTEELLEVRACCDASTISRVPAEKGVRMHDPAHADDKL